MLRVLCAVVVLALSAMAGATEFQLKRVAFWRASEGLWLSENSYFNPAMDYNIRAYHSILHIELQGGELLETEYKFYPPGKYAAGYARGLLTDDRGVETVTLTRGRMVDDRGRVQVQSVRPQYDALSRMGFEVLGDSSALRVVSYDGDPVSAYRMLIDMPSPDHRYLANFGLIHRDGDSGEPGDLRGFSLFRARRIAPDSLSEQRARLRQLYRVGAVLQSDRYGRPELQLLD